jgi:hypothetical protein
VSDRDRDRLGRRRRPGQERGLRPLHPALPAAWHSRALRVAMAAEDWARFDALVATLGDGEPSQARACGQAIAQLMHEVEAPRDERGLPNTPGAGGRGPDLI